ncbi:shikimate dehydrogenase [Oscillospiraceae bacterium OttesenSCG-928-G22]|nr:shikimate dehydrogenase [Oscillospiraceae bacterium OttesenSCG-928-G22]
MERFGLIGDPVAHSLSPDIHRMLFEAYGIDAVYLPMRVPAEKPGLILEAVDMLSLSGFNVTMPHKETVLPLLTELDEGARQAGCVNTVICRRGERVGYTTDGDGFAAGLSTIGRGLTGETVAILGAGGAAKAVALRAAKDGAKRICAFCRTEAAGRRLKEALRTETGADMDVLPFDMGLLEAQGSTLLVNATPIGMSGCRSEFGDYSFLDALPMGALVCDLIYYPRETRLLCEAARRGLAVQNGLPMLLWQAFFAFSLFCGVMPGYGDYRRIYELLSK